VVKKKRGITVRFGPLGLSLLAAGITAVGVAAVSVADSGNGSGGGGEGDGARTFEMHIPPGGAPGVAIAGPDLSAEDRQKMEEFRRCMQDSGAPAPPAPGDFDPRDRPPQPPSAEDRERLGQAFETCKEKLPEKLRDAGPPGLHFRGCAPGAPGDEGENRERGQNQSNDSGGSPSGSAA
jgi:hypothetical protein